MPDWKILIADRLEQSGLAILGASAQVDDRAGITGEELLQAIGAYHALIVRSRTQVTSTLLLAAAQLKVIGRAGAGVDNIDLDAAKTRRLVVVNAPAAASLAVAELTLGLIFCLARSIPYAHESMKRGAWIKTELRGVELSGKILGVIGMGNIGALVSERAAALGVRILGHDPLLPSEEIHRRHAQPASLQDLYTQSDFISLHVPLTPETRGMLNEGALHMMKPGVRIVCTARGGLIDEAALLRALESGQVAGAALDVFAQEPPGLTRLIAHPNVTVTPHIGAQTQEAQKRVAEDIASEVLAALRGETLRCRVV